MQQPLKDMVLYRDEVFGCCCFYQMVSRVLLLKWQFEAFYCLCLCLISLRDRKGSLVQIIKRLTAQEFIFESEKTGGFPCTLGLPKSVLVLVYGAGPSHTSSNGVLKCSRVKWKQATEVSVYSWPMLSHQIYNISRQGHTFVRSVCFKEAPQKRASKRTIAVRSIMPQAIERWVCPTCAVQYADPVSETPPRQCKICEDERQYIKEEGQTWTTLTDISKTHKNVITEEESGLIGIGIDPPIGIGNRALLVKTGEHWDCAYSGSKILPQTPPLVRLALHLHAFNPEYSWATPPIATDLWNLNPLEL